MSFTESLVNVAIGYGIAIAAQEVIFPLFGVHIPFRDNLTIGAMFTVISIVRSYCLRRVFNWWHCRPIISDFTRSKVTNADIIDLDLRRK